MATFFVNTVTGQIATQRQLIDAGTAGGNGLPPRPWHRIQGSSDATTLWYAVLRKRVARRGRKDGGEHSDGIYIGSLAIRHQPHHASLLRAGWEEVPVDQIGPDAPAARPTREPG